MEQAEIRQEVVVYLVRTKRDAKKMLGEHECNARDNKVLLTMHTCNVTVTRPISQPTTLSLRKKLYTEPSPKCFIAYFSSASDCCRARPNEKRLEIVRLLFFIVSIPYDVKPKIQHRPIMIARSTTE